MAKQQLLSARDYFDEVTRPAYQQYTESPSSFFTAYSLVNTLFHVSEWIFHYKEQDLQNLYGASITSGNKLFTDVVETEVTDAGLIKDLNNISKHVKIDRNPSTAMHHSANTHIIVASFGTGSYGTGRYGGGPNITLKEGSREVLLDDVAKRVFDFWEVLIDKLDPPGPSLTIATSPNTPPSANS